MGLITAAAMAGASLAGSALDRRAQGKATNKANAASAARTQAAMSALQPGYQAAQGIRRQALGTGTAMRQQGMQQGLGMIGSLYGPSANLSQMGNVAAQRALLAGLQMQRSAIMGGPIDYSALQPTQLNYDPQLLAGILGQAQLPQGQMNYSEFPTGQPLR